MQTYNFADVIKAARFVFGDEYMVTKFDCSKPTMKRWISEEARPVSSYEKLIIKELRPFIEERKALIDLIQHDAGYGIQMSGYVDMRVLESDHRAVCEFFDDGTNMGDYEEHIFDSITDAVDKFLEIRHRRQLGLDYGRKESSLIEARQAALEK